MATTRMDRRGSTSGRQKLTGVGSYGIDVPPSDQERQNELTAAATILADRRASIEQAKAMLMPIYAPAPRVAFEPLKRRSEVTNMKLHLLARQVVAAISNLMQPTVTPTRSRAAAFIGKAASCPLRETVREHFA